MIGAIFSCLLIALGGHWGIYASYVSFSLCYAFMAPAYTMGKAEAEERTFLLCSVLLRQVFCSFYSRNMLLSVCPI